MTQGLLAHGIYASELFDLAGFEPFMPRTVELGRACLAREHRTLPAIVNLWMGVGGFMNLFDNNYVFGCCSLTSQDPDDGWRALKTIRAQNHLHATLSLAAKPHSRCGERSRENDPDIEALRLPKAVPHLSPARMRKSFPNPPSTASSAQWTLILEWERSELLATRLHQMSVPATADTAQARRGLRVRARCARACAWRDSWLRACFCSRAGQRSRRFPAISRRKTAGPRTGPAGGRGGAWPSRDFA